MKATQTLLISSLFLFITCASCGPNEHDKAAARQACLMMGYQQEMVAAKGTDRESVTFQIYNNALKDYAKYLAPQSDADQVKKLMKENCGEKAELFDEIFKSK